MSFTYSVRKKSRFSGRWIGYFHLDMIPIICYY